MKPLPQSDIDSIVTRCADLWPLLEGKRLFITGGTGFVGRWMVESARAAKVVQFIAPARCDGFDVRTLGSRYETADGEDVLIPDYILHLSSTDLGHADETADVIVNGTRRVLAFAKQSRCQRMLNVSSGAAHYGQSVYGQAKRLAESLCDASGVPTVHARIFALVGPGCHLDRQYAVGNFIRDALAGGPIRVRSDGTARRSYAYISDVCVTLWHLLLTGSAGGKYDVGSPDARTILEVARQVAQEFDPPPTIEVEGFREQTAEADYVPYGVRGSQFFYQQYNFADAVRRTVQWFRPSPMLAAMEEIERIHARMSQKSDDDSVRLLREARDWAMYPAKQEPVFVTIPPPASRYVHPQTGEPIGNTLAEVAAWDQLTNTA